VRQPQSWCDPAGASPAQVRGSADSWEADEQSGVIRRGVGGAKGRDRGECGPTKHAPDSEPGKRHTGCWLAYGNLVPSIPEVGEAMGRAVEVVAPSSSL
jgi:hypothetical protein